MSGKDGWYDPADIHIPTKSDLSSFLGEVKSRGCFMALVRMFSNEKRVRRLLRLSLNVGVVLVFLAAMLSFNLTGANAVSNWLIETVYSGSFPSMALDPDGYPISAI